MTGAHLRYLTHRASYASRPARLLPPPLGELADLASFGSWLRQPHRATPDTERAWNGAVEISRSPGRREAGALMVPRETAFG